jgi:hypothetical protein
MVCECGSEHCRCCGCCLGAWDHCPRCGCEEYEERHRSEHNETTGERHEGHPMDANRPSWDGVRGPATEAEAQRWNREYRV